MGQLRQFSESIDTRHSMFGDEQAAKEGLIEMSSKHLLLIAEKDSGERAGFIGGWLMAHPFNRKIRLLVEIFWWVAKEHRNSRAGLALLNAYVEFGKTRADCITLALEANSPVKEETLAKRGFHLHERSYLLEIA